MIDFNFSNVWGTFKTQLLRLLNTIVISEENIELQPDNFIEASDHEGFLYRATIPIVGVTSSYFPFVSFSSEALSEGCFYNTIVESYNGGVYIYSREMPTKSVIINCIKCII